MQQMTDAQRKLAEDNMNLVYYVVSHDYPTFIKDDDVIQSGTLGLCKAAMKWEEGKSAFSTYACRCIKNEIRQELRQRQPHLEVLSLDHPIGEDLTLGDIIEGDSGVDYLDDHFLLTLTDDEQLVYDLRLRGYKNKDIAEITGFNIRKVQKILRTIRIKKETY